MKTKIATAVALYIAVCISSCKKEDLTSVPVTASDESDMYLESALPVQTPITYNINNNIGGYLQALPAHYADHPNKHYPLIIFLHGIGEEGDGSQSSLPIVANNSIPHLIATQTFPANFKVKNFDYQFVVLSPQFKWWPSPADVDAVINYAVANYKVDSTKIYLCGLSMGGGGVWDYAWSGTNRVAAIVTMSGASYPTTEKAAAIVNDSIGVWAFHNSDDPTVPAWYSIDYVQYINSYNPYVPARLTLWPTGGHDSWSKASDPNYKENGKNIYEWMLSYRKKRKK